MALCLFPLCPPPWLSSSLSPPSFLPPFIQLRVLYLLKENTSYLAIIVDCTERCKNSRASPRDRALRFPRLVSHNESTATKPGARQTQYVSNPVSLSPSSFKALLFVNIYSILGFHNLLKQHTPRIFIIPERTPPLFSICSVPWHPPGPGPFCQPCAWGDGEPGASVPDLAGHLGKGSHTPHLVQSLFLFI